MVLDKDRVWNVSKPFSDIQKNAQYAPKSRKDIQMNKLFPMLLVSFASSLILGGCASETIDESAVTTWVVNGQEMTYEQAQAYAAEHPRIVPPQVVIDKLIVPENEGRPATSADFELMASLPANAPGVKSFADQAQVQTAQADQSGTQGQPVYLGSGSSPTPPPGIGGGQYRHIIVVPRRSTMNYGGYDDGYYGGYGGYRSTYAYQSYGSLGLGGGVFFESGLNDPSRWDRPLWGDRDRDNRRCGNNKKK